jgi:hypothetical protein
MQYKFLPRRVTLLVFDDKDNVNYTAACQININGKYGTIDTLVGGDFYKMLAEYGYQPFKDLGLVEISAAVTYAHLRLLKRQLRDIKITEVEEPSTEDSHLKLCWIRITEKSPLE